MIDSSEKVQVIDSHTAGEPTRVVLDGALKLGTGTMVELRDRFQENGDWLRSSLLSEPRGFEAMVGALLCESLDSRCEAGVVFFNNAGVLKGCLHGTMGLIKTLEFMGRISFGEHFIETPVGVIKADLRRDGSVQVTNVSSYRYLSNVELNIEGYDNVRGDVAWGGNWFFLVESGGPEISHLNIGELSSFSVAVMNELESLSITGKDGAKIDHVEIFGPSEDPIIADSKNFVMCPGGEYDRSPCGTGTSAKLACLYESGKLKVGQKWKQAGILGTVFEGEILQEDRGNIVPLVSGQAWVNGKYELIVDPSDPFCYGFK